LSSEHYAVSHSPFRRSDFQKKPSSSPNDQPAAEATKPEAKNGAAPTDKKPSSDEKPPTDEKKKRKKYCFLC
jgi:hypothetical protein